MTEVGFATFLIGISVGLAVAVPIGPMGLLCIQRTLAAGVGGGLAIGLAAATVQVVYGSLAVMGLGPALTALAGAGAVALSLGSAGVLFWFAARLLRTRVDQGHVSRAPRDLVRSYGAALTFGFCNPLTVILFLAAFPALASAADLVQGPTLIGGVFAGAMGWYLVLASGTALLRSKLSDAALTLINRAAGLLLAGLAIVLIGQAFGLLT